MKIKHIGDGLWECLYQEYKMLIKISLKSVGWQVFCKTEKIGKGKQYHIIEATEAAKANIDAHKESLKKKSRTKRFIAVENKKLESLEESKSGVKI